MKKAISAFSIFMLTILSLSFSTASAWHFGISSIGACQENGTYKITWTVDNSDENEAFKVTYSTNTSVVPVGTKVPKYSTSDFTQTVDGTKSGTFFLTLKGNWPSDQTIRTQQGMQRISEACAQPQTPEEPKTPETPQTPVTPQVLGDTTTQVTTTPVGPVNAGEGHETISTAALAGLAISVAAFAYGIVRVLKRQV